MDTNELTARVRALRAKGATAKQIARQLGLPPATIVPLVRAIAADNHAAPADRPLHSCWVSPAWSTGLGIDGHLDWPRNDHPASSSAGLAAVLVARHYRHGKLAVCGYLCDVYCLGVKNATGPDVIDEAGLPDYRRTFFSGYPSDPLEAPIELARHLVRGSVDYARGLGFDPHPDYTDVASYLGGWGGWDGNCAITFGENGKPCYISGPYDNSHAIVCTLDRAVGSGNYNFILIAE